MTAFKHGKLCLMEWKKHFKSLVRSTLLKVKHIRKRNDFLVILIFFNVCVYCVVHTCVYVCMTGVCDYMLIEFRGQCQVSSSTALNFLRHYVLVNLELTMLARLAS